MFIIDRRIAWDYVEIAMEKKSTLGLSKNVWSLGWVSLFNDIASEMIYPLLPFS